MRRLFLLTLLFVFAVTASFAGTIVGDFNLDTGLNTIASQGQITFTLNVNGTISASLVSFNAPILGFGFNSVGTNLFESGFSPTAPANPFGWTDSFGTQESGFLCTSCGFSESWTIGNPGDFSSVSQALGGSTSTVDFFLVDSLGNQSGAQAHGPTAVPEPGSLALIAASLGVVAAFRRRRASLMNN